MTSFGAVFTPSYPPERLRSVVAAAEDAGLDQLWLWEDCFREGGISNMAAALAWTERLRVGVGVMPFPLRNVALTAMEVASLERMFPGRPVIGVGHGVLGWMGQVGARAASPLTLMREYIAALRSLLAGQRITTAGQYVQLTDVALDWPPASAPGIHAAATGPKTLRLSGEVADGTVLTGGTSPAQIRAARAAINEGRSAAGRTDSHTITVYLRVAPGPDGAAKLAADEAAFGEHDLYGAAGDAIPDAIAEVIEAGADSVILQPPYIDENPESFMTWAATAIAHSPSSSSSSSPS